MSLSPIFYLIPRVPFKFQQNSLRTSSHNFWRIGRTHSSDRELHYTKFFCWCWVKISGRKTEFPCYTHGRMLATVYPVFISSQHLTLLYYSPVYMSLCEKSSLPPIHSSRGGLKMRDAAFITSLMASSPNRILTAIQMRRWIR